MEVTFTLSKVSFTVDGTETGFGVNKDRNSSILVIVVVRSTAGAGAGAVASVVAAGARIALNVSTAHTEIFVNMC